MTKEQLEQEAENFIIKRYKIFNCYIVDTEETRQSMSHDVYSDYEEEYQCYLAGLRAREKQIAKLEKENAELKEKLNFSTQYYQGEKAKKQLTKAKEIIKEYIRINLLPPIERNFDDEVKLFTKAEDFIKE